MGSSKMAINSLLQDSPSSPRAPVVSQHAHAPSHAAQVAAAPPRNSFTAAPLSKPGSPVPPPIKKATRSRRKDAPLLVQRAVTSPQQPDRDYSRTSTPSLPHNSVIHAQRSRHSPPLSSTSTIGSTRTINSALSTPPGEHRPLLGGRIMTTPPVPQNWNPTEKMDFLADLAAMQHPQQGQAARSLRNSIDQPRSPSLSRKGSAMPQSNDHPMSDAPTATLQPRNFTASSLSKSDLQAVADLTKQLSENTFLYESHTKLIKLLHQGLMSHISPIKNTDDFQHAHSYSLLHDLRQAREAMDSRFPVGEELWIEWIQDECMLSRTIDERIAVMDLCLKAVRDEVGSTKIWRLYGDWMWHLYRTAHDVSTTYEGSLLGSDTVVGKLLANQHWTEDEKVVGREVFNWTLMIEVWEEGVKATEWHIDASHVVWDPYFDLFLHDLNIDFSPEKVQKAGNMFNARLRQPHATWDETFQKFSQFVSRYDNANYESIMVSTNDDAAQAKTQYSLRQEYESNLQRASASGDKDTEWTVMTEYLEWEATQAKKPKRFANGLDLYVALSQRANLRFPTDASLWEDHVDFLTECTVPGYSLLSVAHNATRHCPWSGSLWSKRLIALEAAGNAFTEIEDVKHHATSSGLLEEVGGMDEVIRVFTSWCGYLRRRAFAGDAGEDDIDVAEMGIRSELENVKSIGEKKYGKDFKGDAEFRVQRIYVKFLTQAGRYDEVRAYWLQLSTTYGDRWEFWDRFYGWEMSVWGRNYTTAGKINPPEHATAALQRSIRQPNLDWPERMIDMYLHHCAQHETVQKLQEAQVEATRATKQIVKRRAKEAADAAAAQYQQAAAVEVAESVEDTAVTGKRKRETTQDEAPSKRNKAAEDDKIEPAQGDALSTAAAQLKRDRENSTVIVKKLPHDATESKVRQFFRDCGNIVKLGLVPNDEDSTVTATIEFEFKEDVLTAQTRSMKPFHGTSIEIQVGDGTTLFVANYPPEADEEYMINLFKPYGEVIDVRFPSLRFNSHRRFCYVQFLSSQDAKAASVLDGKALGGKLVLQAKLSDPTAKNARIGALEEGREVYVGNIHYRAEEKDVKTLFNSYGKVLYVRIPQNIEGKKKGTAFVVFGTKEEADAALDMNLKEFMGRVLVVSIAKTNAKGPKRAATTIINAASPDADSMSHHDSPAADVASIGTAGSPAATGNNAESGGHKDHHSRTLILRNIPDTVNDARIRALTEPYGALRKITLIPKHGEVTVEFVDVKDVGKAELGLAGKEITKGVFVEVGPGVSSDDVGVVAAANGDAGARKKTTQTMMPVVARRPTQAGGGASRRGGRGGLGFKRAAAPVANDANATDIGDKLRVQAAAAAGGDVSMKDANSVGEKNVAGMDNVGPRDNAATGTAGESKSGKSQADFRAMLGGGK